MGNIPETNQRDMITRPPSSGGIDWDAQPASLTTREAAALLGKSAANVRARASKGDFGPTATGPDGLPRYDRDRVRIVGERMATRQAQTGAVFPPVAPPNPSVAVLLTALQAQQEEQAALYKAWLEEAREAARQAREEANELRAALHNREETNRATLTRMDVVYEQAIAQLKKVLIQEQTLWKREIADKGAEIERLKAASVPEKGRPQLWRK